MAAMMEEKKREEKGATKAKKSGGNGASDSAHAGANGKAVAFATKGVEAATTNKNGPAEAEVVGEKKKRKRNKKKGGIAGVPESRPALVKPAAPPTVEHWEVAPKVEEWQEVNTKKTKPKGAPLADVPAFARRVGMPPPA